MRWEDDVLPKRIIQYISAPDFQSAAKLAGTSKKITRRSGGAGNPIIGDMSGALLSLEEIASEASDFHDTEKLKDIGSQIFSVVDNRLLKIELLAVNIIQE
jgi:hypothetical protein